MELKFKNHDSGFFSTITLILFQIIDYYKKNNKNPIDFDCSNVFSWYCPSNKNTFHKFFKIKNRETLTDINLKEHNKNNAGTLQFTKYQEHNLDVYYKYVDVYFNLSEQVQNIYDFMITKYKLDHDNTCCLFLRGNDKATECNIPNYNEYIIKGKRILSQNKNIKFLIQSDEKEFIDEMKNNFPNNIVFYDEIRIINKNIAKTVDEKGLTREKNYKYILNFLAIVVIMSKCKYVICNTGNISLWILFFRKNINNFCQI